MLETRTHVLSPLTSVIVRYCQFNVLLQQDAQICREVYDVLYRHVNNAH